MAKFSSPFYWLTAALVLALFPYAFFVIGGERFVYAGFLHCFGDAFWTGELYPRSCIIANNGQGAPVFMFYFPLAFWLAMPFYPLVRAGIGADNLIVMMACLFTAAGGLGAYRWLRHYLTPRSARMGAALYMLAPYMSAARFFGAGIAELLVMALWPFLALALAQAGEQKPGSIARLGVLNGLMLLAHMPAALAVCTGSGVYLLVRRWQALPGFALAVLLGNAIAAVYLLPAAYYHRYMVQPQPDAHFVIPLANRYPKMADVFHPESMRLYIGIAFTLLLVLFFAAAICRRRPALDAVLARECRCWLAVFVAGVLLFFPLLEPVWGYFRLLQAAFFPWRMQELWLPAFALLGAAWASMERGPRPGDLVALLALLTGYGFFISKSILPGQDAARAEMVRAAYAAGYEYRSIWLSPGNPQGKAPHIEADPGIAVHEISWGPRAIVLQADSQKPGEILLGQRYFPSFSITGASMRPDASTGMMRLQVAKGGHRIEIREEPYGNGPWWVRIAPWISLCGLAAAACLLRRKVKD